MKEQHYRSVIKGASWRVVASLDTVFLAWVFTGHIGSALKIGAIEVLTKILLFYLHERIWLRLNFWRTKTVLPDGSVVIKDKHYRSVVKGASYRLFGTIDTIIIAFFITGHYDQAFKIGITEVVTKVGLFYLHERVWAKIKLGVHSVEKVPATNENEQVSPVYNQSIPEKMAS